MAKKLTLKGCPCCGEKAFWIKGNLDARMTDRVQCLECGLEMEGTHEPQSSLDLWNARFNDHFIQDREVNIEGENL